MEALKDRLLRYINVVTTADPTVSTHPSNPNITTLGQMLVNELIAFSCTSQVGEYTQNGAYCVCAKILANQTVKDIPTIGFIAHMDTSAAYPGVPDPVIIQGFKTLKDKYNVDLRSKTFTEQEYQKWLETGVLVNDTPLNVMGVNNKAGIAEIMGLVEYIDEHPDMVHGQINICFLSDAEIGTGVDEIENQGSKVQVTDPTGNPVWIDPATGNTSIVNAAGMVALMRLEGGFMDADMAFEIAAEGEDHVEYNNYNVSNMTIEFLGSKVLGTYDDEAAINAIKNASLFVAAMVNDDLTLTMDTGAGIAFVKSLNGDYNQAVLELQIRDLDKSGVTDKVNRIIKILQTQNFYNTNTVSYTVVDKYANIRTHIPTSMRSLAIQSSYDLYLRGVVATPIHHGYVCAQMTAKGVPTLALSSGGYNYYSPNECIPIPSLDNCLTVLVNIIKNSWTMDFSSDFS